MLIPRFISGFFLVALAAGVLIGDAYLPLYPCLFITATLFAGLATWELTALLPAAGRPRTWLSLGGVLAVIAANWIIPLGQTLSPDQTRLSLWAPVLFTFVGVMLIAFAIEIVRFREAGQATSRIANTAFTVAYLGLLPSFLVQLRWHPDHAGQAIFLAIFVPKIGDIGAYFSGRFLGKHKMSPTLSPKKTWEGFAGGLMASVLTAVIAALSWTPGSGRDLGIAVGFGLTVGLAGVLGDLAESLIKRDAGAKDAARSIPGFGGVLDVIDSVLFAAPVAYLWFMI